MSDIRPCFTVEGDLLRMYKSKKLGKLITSKNVKATVSGDCFDACRETLVHHLGDNIYPKIVNRVNSSNPYKIEPLIFHKIKRGTYVGQSELMMDLKNSLNIVNKLSGMRDDVLKSLNAVVGIIGVAMSNSSKERSRRANLGAPNELAIRGSMISYRVLSPFWLISPVTVSIMTGLARNVISDVADGKAPHKSIHKKYSEATINKVITSADRASAIRIYKNAILPFYDGRRGENRFLNKSDETKVITKFVEKGVFSFFDPKRVYDYWHDEDYHFGLRDFIDKYGTSGRKWSF
jgi:hypothetical protein